jgi:hypothetical protein
MYTLELNLDFLTINKNFIHLLKYQNHIFVWTYKTILNVPPHPYKVSSTSPRGKAL